MSGDSVTEVTHKSWFTRLSESVGGIIIGIILILVSFPLLFWNEGRAVQRYKTLQEGAGAVVSISADTVDSAHEGSLVHLTGLATTDEVLADTALSVSANAIKLRREVEMFQWEEHVETESEKELGGGETTRKTYTYEKTWSSQLIDSNGFAEPTGHYNPKTMPFESTRLVASHVTLGAFTLSSGLINKVHDFEPLTLTEFPAGMPTQAQLHNGGYYLGTNPQSPQVGDVRISYAVVKPTTISLVARQTGSSFAPYETDVGGTIELLETGEHTAAAMFESAHAANTMTTWLLRLVGFVLMMSGFATVFKPLSVVFDVIPFLGNLVGAGTGIVAFVLALTGSAITIALGWVFYRPIVAAVLIGIAVMVIGGGVMYGRSRRKQHATTS